MTFPYLFTVAPDCLQISFLFKVADPLHFIADRDPSNHFYADPDPSYHFDADPDPSFHFNADPDSNFHFNADPEPDPVPHLSDAKM
jgi:hypothetical protein